MNRRFIVVGGGITGLIIGYYVPDALIISPDYGGILSEKNFLFRLHDISDARELLDDLDLDYEIETCKIGYYYNNKFYSDCSDSLRNEYYEKTRGEKCDKQKHEFMTQGLKEFQYIDVSVSELIKRLRKNFKGVWIDDTVSSIDDLSKIVYSSSHAPIHYERIVSTIPAPDICRVLGMYDLIDKFEYTPKIVQFVSKDYYGLEASGFDYVYFPEFETPIIRVSKEAFGYVHEYPPSSIVADNFHKIRYGNLLNAPSSYYAKMNQKEIGMMGRYAMWNQSLLVHDMIHLVNQFAKKMWVS